MNRISGLESEQGWFDGFPLCGNDSGGAAHPTLISKGKPAIRFEHNPCKLCLNRISGIKIGRRVLWIPAFTGTTVGPFAFPTGRWFLLWLAGNY
jgi:hypothetical protein